MNFKGKASIATFLLKILGISVLLIFGVTLVVKGDNFDLKNVKIEFDNGSSIHILTTKSTVSQILSENHILLLEDETTFPNLEDALEDNNTIKIFKIKNESIETSALVEDIINIDTLADNYSPITEKIITIQEEIPFETIQKNVSNDSSNTTSTVLQEGVVGIRETKYKAKFKNGVELIDLRELISSEIIREPINKIVQVVAKIVATSRSTVIREPQIISENETNIASSNSLAQAVEGKTPIVKTFNTSAYTASTCDKSSYDPGYGITASGAKAESWYTIAAGKEYPMGTIIYIPYFENKPNGGWFVVQDRGGAISNSKLDIYMDTYSECISFGRQNLECYVYI